MSERALDGEPVDLLVRLRWDDYNTGLFVEKLFRHVRREELRFDLEARTGSVETTLAIDVETELTVDVTESIVRYLLERTNRVDQDLPSPEVVLRIDGEDREFALADEDHVRDIVRGAREKVLEEGQRNLDDFSR